jgi:hypothetical protein
MYLDPHDRRFVRMPLYFLLARSRHFIPVSVFYMIISHKGKCIVILCAVNRVAQLTEYFIINKTENRPFGKTKTFQDKSNKISN